MNHVPIVGKTILARIFAHRRNRDAVLEGDIAQFQRLEQVGHDKSLNFI
jgi:hypothetical protein